MFGIRARLLPLLGSLVTLPAVCNVYRTDVGKLCDAEQLSQSSLKTDRSQIFAWMHRNVASMDAVQLVSDLEGKDAHGISVRLREQARVAGLTSCALAEHAEMQGKDDDFHTDVVNLCAGNAPRDDGSSARLDVVQADDTERIREIVDWTKTNAKSPDTMGIVNKLVAVAARQRGALLRAEAAKVGVTSCLMASTLDYQPPPAAARTERQLYPTYSVVKIEGGGKSQGAIVAAVVGKDSASSVNACYGTALTGTPTLTGKVVLQLVFDPGGHVLKVTDEGSPLKTLAPCVAAALGGLTVSGPMDTSKKAGKVVVTFLFTSTSTGPGYTASFDPGGGGAGGGGRPGRPRRR